MPDEGNPPASESADHRPEDSFDHPTIPNGTEADSTIPPDAAGKSHPKQTAPISFGGATTRPRSRGAPGKTGANPDAPVPFVFGGQIARGGMGAIHEADDCKIGRKVAVKVMLSQTSQSTEQHLRFVREAAVLGRLAHPNIVPVHDLGRDGDGQLYYSMKLVKGRTLQDIINKLREKDPETLAYYTLDRLLTIFRKVCDAIGFAHAEHIIHRDLKPENIMVGEFGEVLVMDWGLSKILDDVAEEQSTAAYLSTDASSHSRSASATMDGAVMGTPQYMSPEQARGETTDMDVRSDIYSLGGILYALLTLRAPVEGRNVSEVLAKVLAGEVTPPSEVAPGGKRDAESGPITALPHIATGTVPNALSAVAMKALSRRREDRYPEVASLGSEIEKWQSGFATSAEHAGLFTQLALLIKRNRTVFATAGIAWVVITALVVWFVIHLQAKEKRAREGETAAQEAKAAAERDREKARLALAESSIQLAESALRDHHGILMQSALNRVPEDYRDNTWAYLKEQSDASIFTDHDSGLTFTKVAGQPKLSGVFIGSVLGGYVRAVDIGNGKVLLNRKTPYGRLAFALSPDGERFAISSQSLDERISIHDAATGRAIRSWKAERTHSLEFHDGGRHLLQLRWGEFGHHRPAIWDTTTGELLWETDWAGARTDIRFVPGSDLMVEIESGAEMIRTLTLDGRETAKWSLSERQTKGRQKGGAVAMAVDQAGSRVIHLDDHGLLRGIDLQQRETFFELEVPRSSRSAIAFEKDASSFVLLLTLTDGRSLIQVRDTASGVVTRHLRGQQRGVRDIAVNPATGEVFAGGERSAAWEGTRPADWQFPFYQRVGGRFWHGDDFFVVRARLNRHSSHPNDG